MTVVELDRPPFAAPLRAADRFAVTGDTGTERALVAYKTVDVRDPYMAGHFPGLTMLPAVFLLEAVRQVVAADRVPYGRCELLAVQSIRLRAPMRGGDEIRLDLVLRPEGATAWRVRAACVRQDGVAVAELKLTAGRTGGEPGLDPPAAPPAPAASHARTTRGSGGSSRCGIRCCWWTGSSRSPPAGRSSPPRR
ncbi:hotdog family protein [Amycolatopsis aidingensis]|uniref:hypothetical protein n=1 Tax=Amycolatopsis aidingensis TaxID=2842453 RepID=UPI001C0E30B1|nr:hypothetical protein [Amycolatopsis aidingensis]